MVVIYEKHELEVYQLPAGLGFLVFSRCRMPLSKVNRQYRYSELLKIKPEILIKFLRCFYIKKHSVLML